MARSRTIQVGDHSIAVLKVAPLMGCEEIVFPLLVWEWNAARSFRRSYFERLGKPMRFVDLNCTTMGGVCAMEKAVPHRITEEAILFRGGPLPDEAIEQMAPIAGETEYGVIFEDSTHPLAHGYLSRCRVLSKQAFGRLYPTLPALQVRQPIPAGEFLSELPVMPSRGIEARLAKCYSGGRPFTLPDGDQPSTYWDWGDSDRYSVGIGFWRETEGVYRLWSRVVHIPQ